jgi:prepilin-type N-terminal cleavage/methylation domain-containing protein
VHTERRERSDAGFTIIEVLIAMVLLAVGLLSLEAVGIGAARLNARAERQSAYVARATGQMESALRDVRRVQALTAATPATLTLPDGAVMTTSVKGSDGDNVAATNELYTVQVKVKPAAGNRVLRNDSVLLTTNTYVSPTLP